MPTLFDANLLALMTAPHAEPNSPASRAGRLLQEAAEAQPLKLAVAAGRRLAAKEAMDAKAAETVGIERSEYFRFVSIDVRHGFFNHTGGVSGLVAVRPTAETRRRLALYGLIARPRPDGIDLLWTTALRDQAVAQLVPLVNLIAAIPEAERAKVVESIGYQLFGPPLFFTVSLSNPLFANFTQMPNARRIGEPPIVLSTRETAQLDSEEHRGDLIVDWDARAVTRPQAMAPPALPAWAKQASARAALAKEKPAKAASKRKEMAQAGDTSVAVDAALGAEERELIVTGSRQFALLDLYLVRAPGKAPAAGQWDGMPISLEPVGDERDAAGRGIFHNCTYTLRFEARQTRWRYIVARRDGNGLDRSGLAVVLPGGADAGFVPDGERVLPDGRTALCLASTAPLPILARPTRPLSLMGMPSGGRARRGTLVDRLPAAGPASISPDLSPGPPRAGEPPPAWSDIYVFV